MGNRSAWQVARVRPEFENVAAAHLSQKGFEVFLPPCGSLYQGSDRKKWSEKPLFPGYLFCRINGSGKQTLLTTPGVLHLVGIGEDCWVDESEVVALKIIVQSAQPYEPGTFSYTGPKIRVHDGPLRNLEGVLVNPKRHARIAVGLSLLQRSVLVDLPQDTHFKQVPGNGLTSMPVPA